MMAVNMQGIELAPERRKGVGTIDRRQYLPAGGLFPEDLEVVYRLMPIPYNLNMELGIYASNTDQLHQILEQILLLFDPTVQIQKNDKALDWTRLTHVELTGINNEENYPMGQDKRIVQWSLNFTMPINLSAPMELRDNIIQEIILRIGNMNGFVVMDYSLYLLLIKIAADLSKQNKRISELNITSNFIIIYLAKKFYLHCLRFLS
jgi:hypothetical protein